MDSSEVKKYIIFFELIPSMTSKDKKKSENDNADRYKGEAGNFTSLESDEGPGP